MISTNNVVHLLSTLVSKSSTSVNTLSSPIQPREEELAQYLFSTIESISNCSSYSIENDTTLELDRTVEEFNNEYSDNDEDGKSYDDDYEHESENLQRHYSLEYMEKVVNYYDEKDPKTGKRKRSWSTVQARFPRVPYQQYISRFRYYLEAHGTKKQKIEKVEEYVFDKFEKAREQLLPLHDLDLKRWALMSAREHSLNNFTASHGWIDNFKHRHNICSRKITKFVTRRQVESQDLINQSADSFVAEARKIFEKYDEENILNTDQIGIELELHSNRTLSYQGEKTTVASVRSMNATTHSYAVQQTISLGGHLIGPVFVCLKEIKG